MDINTKPYDEQVRSVRTAKINARYATYCYHMARALEEKAHLDWMIAADLAAQREQKLSDANEELRVREYVLEYMAQAIALQEAEERKEQ